jgi:hypothetical protein
MKKLQHLVPMTALALTLALSSNKAAAQPGMGGPMGDPKQMAQMQVDGLRDSLAVTNDDEWKVISPRLLKVVQIKSEIFTADMMRMMAPMMARMGGDGRMGGGANPFGGRPDPSADALQKTLDGNAPGAEVKAALARFRDSKKQKQAELTKAQDALKEVLNNRQEAVLALAGYLE